MESHFLKETCGRETNSFPIILVPNMNSILVPPLNTLNSPLSSSIQYLLPITQDNNSLMPDNDDDSLEKRIKFLTENARFVQSSSGSLFESQLSSPKIFLPDLKSVSPMQFFNIQDNNDGIFLGSDESPYMFRKICESALLHESSKDVTLVGGQQPSTATLLEEISTPSKNVVFSEPSEMNDLFVPIVELNSEQLPVVPCGDIPLSEKVPSKEEEEEMEEQVEGKNISCALSLCSLRNSAGELTGELAGELSSASSDIGDESQRKEPAEKREGKTQTIIVHLKEESQSGSKDETEAKPFSFSSPSDTLDVSLIPVLPMESLMLGNFTLLQGSCSPIKLQVIDDDGVVKRISLNPLCQTEEPLTVCTLTSEQDDSNDPGFSPSTVTIPSPDTEKTEIKPFRCELCNATFNRLGNYTRHKKIHMVPNKEDQRFNCDVCGKNFIQRCDLTRHRHIHTGTEPHRCNTCGKGYIRHSDLVIHQRFHNKEKPFACSHCTKGFSQRGDLNRHLRSIHLQVKPLTCGHCHKKFAKEATLIRHMQVNHGDIILDSLAKCSSEGILWKPSKSDLSCHSSAELSALTTSHPS